MVIRGSARSTFPSGFSEGSTAPSCLLLGCHYCLWPLSKQMVRTGNLDIFASHLEDVACEWHIDDNRTALVAI